MNHLVHRKVHFFQIKIAKMVQGNNFHSINRKVIHYKELKMIDILKIPKYIAVLLKIRDFKHNFLKYMKMDLN